MVILDDTLDRTTNGTGSVMEKTFAQLRSLDAGRGEMIPTLEEIFEAVNHRAIIKVELKGPRTTAPVAALIDDCVRQRGWRYEFSRLLIRPRAVEANQIPPPGNPPRRAVRGGPA